MIYSYANLKVSGAASKDKTARGMNGVFFDGDGSTVATNGAMLVAVGPAREEMVYFPEAVGEQMRPGKQHGILMPVEAVEKAQKHMSKDKRLSLRHLAMTRVSDPGRVGFTSLDPDGNATTSSSVPRSETFPDWRGVLRRIAGEKADRVRVCVNRHDLVQMLNTVDSACPDRSEMSPIFLEVGRGLVVRTANRETGQRCVGAVATYDTGGRWLEHDEWERRVFSVSAKLRRIRRLGRGPKDH